MFLNTHTYYSLRYGTIAPKELLELASKLKINTLVLTDVNNTSANLEFVRLARNYQIKPVLGVDFRNGVKQQFVMIAKNNNGLQHINNYLADFLHTKKPIPDKARLLPNTFTIYPFDNAITDLQKNEFIGIKPSDLNHLKLSEWQFKQEKLVILKTVSFQNKKGFNTHRLLRAIDNNTLLMKLD